MRGEWESKEGGMGGVKGSNEGVKVGNGRVKGRGSGGDGRDKEREWGVFGGWFGGVMGGEGGFGGHLGGSGGFWRSNGGGRVCIGGGEGGFG